MSIHKFTFLSSKPGAILSPSPVAAPVAEAKDLKMEIGVEPPSLPPPLRCWLSLLLVEKRETGTRKEKKPTRWGGRLSSQPDGASSQLLDKGRIKLKKEAVDATLLLLFGVFHSTTARSDRPPPSLPNLIAIGEN